MKKKGAACKEIDKAAEVKALQEIKLQKKDRHLIKFNIAEETLRCFIGKNKVKSFRGDTIEPKEAKIIRGDALEIKSFIGEAKAISSDGKTIVWENKDTKGAINESLSCLLPPLPVLPPSKPSLQVMRYKSSSCLQLSSSTFHNKLLLMDYEQNEPEEKGLIDQVKGEEQEQQDELSEIVTSCMRVITQETEHSSNSVSQHYTPVSSQAYTPVSSQPYTPISSTCYTPLSTSPSFPTGYQNSVSLPLQTPNSYYPFFPFPSGPQRNRRSITTEQSGAYVIDVGRVEGDGRTTIMVRNIPNKYTQDMLLQLFQRRHKKKFDFFYLPIDYNNSCNVGYAFLNFIHTKFIPDFMSEFHDQKWARFNSTKVCKVCYARIQGTAQLQNHFEHSNVLQQKEKKFRPLIGMKSLEQIQELVKRQKQGQKDGQKQGEKEGERKDEFYE